MRARLSRWALSPRTPALVAQRVAQLVVLALAAAVVALLASGLPSHVFAAAVVAVAA